MIVAWPAPRAARSLLFVLSLTVAACATNSNPGDGNGDGGSGDDMATDDFGTSEPDLLGAATGLDVQPAALQTISVGPGATTPTVGYTATLNGQPVSVSWKVDRGDVATITSGTTATAT